MRCKCDVMINFNVTVMPWSIKICEYELDREMSELWIHDYYCGSIFLQDICILGL